MDDFGGKINELEELNDVELLFTMDSALCEWQVMFGISTNAITHPIFKLKFRRAKRMETEYQIPNNEALNGRILDLKHRECVHTRNEVL